MEAKQFLCLRINTQRTKGTGLPAPSAWGKDARVLCETSSTGAAVIAFTGRRKRWWRNSSHRGPLCQLLITLRNKLCFGSALLAPSSAWPDACRPGEQDVPSRPQGRGATWTPATAFLLGLLAGDVAIHKAHRIVGANIPPPFPMPVPAMRHSISSSLRQTR